MSRLPPSAPRFLHVAAVSRPAHPCPSGVHSGGTAVGGPPNWGSGSWASSTESLCQPTSRDEPPPFLTVRRVTFCIDRDPRVVHYDVVERFRRDASVVVAFELIAEKVHVWLRTVLRPPLVLGGVIQPGDRIRCAALWEVAAGLIDAGESPEEAALRELREELGFSSEALKANRLGSQLFGASGVFAERLHFFSVDVTGHEFLPPAGDGSPLEDGATFSRLPLDEAIAACLAGEIVDLKTELILRRLQAFLGMP